MSAALRILDVGQCGIDGPRIKRFLSHELHVEVDRVHSKDEALAAAGKNSYALVLVNRLLDRDRSPGLDVIAALKTSHPVLKCMLVSDRPDAQQQAAALGALPGFGKSALDAEATLALLREAIG